MAGLRDHRIFSIDYTMMIKDRIEDGIGELTGYGPPYRSEVRTVRLVAPNKTVAVAYVTARWKLWEVEVGNVVEHKIDAFLQEHVY